SATAPPAVPDHSAPTAAPPPRAPGLAAADPRADPRADRALLRVASLIGRTADPGEALGEILAAAVETFGAVSGSIALLNPDTGLLEIEVQQGLPDADDRVPLRPGQGV